MIQEDIILSWSGGKDSAFALHTLQVEGKFNVKYLLTNIYKPHRRVSMHGVPEELIDEQARQIGIPLLKLYIEDKTYDEYEHKMKELLLGLKKEGIHKVAFGDLFLEDLRNYRESRLAEIDMQGLFPIWNADTKTMAKNFIDAGFRTHICSINSKLVPEELIGVDFDDNFLGKLPKQVDPCGENGEFHSFCYAGPIFNKRVEFQINGISEQKYEHNNESYVYLFSAISS